MIVRKHMSSPPITVARDTDYKIAIGLMQKHRIRRLPVLDANGALAGIVAERDLLVAADRYLNSPVDVGQIMTRQVVTVGVGTPVVDAATVMIERKIGGLPVIDNNGSLLGIITETDLFEVLASLLKRGGDPRTLPTKRKARAKEPLASPAASNATRRSSVKPAGKTARRGAQVRAGKPGKKTPRKTPRAPR